MNTSRREFIQILGKVILVGSSSQIFGCLYGDISSPKATIKDKYGAIDDNHDHVALLTQEQIVAAKSLTLDITGSSSHPHFLELSTEDVMAIQEGKPISKSTTNDWGHSHLIRFNLENFSDTATRFPSAEPINHIESNDWF